MCVGRRAGRAAAQRALPHGRRGGPRAPGRRGRPRLLHEARPLARRSPVSYGVTSMVAPLRRVLVRRPATAGDWAGAAWRTPDPAGLARQHEAFCALLSDLGAEVEVADALDGQVDAVYMHDPLIMTAAGGIALRMAKPARQAEPGHAADGARRARHPRRGHARGARLSPTAATASGSTIARWRSGSATAPTGRAPTRWPGSSPPSPSRRTTCPTTRARARCCTCSRSCRRSPSRCASCTSRSRRCGCCRTCARAASTGSRSTTTTTPRWAATSCRCGPASSSWSTECRRCGGHSSGAASRSTSTTAPSSRSRATAGRRA